MSILNPSSVNYNDDLKNSSPSSSSPSLSSNKNLLSLSKESSILLIIHSNSNPVNYNLNSNFSTSNNNNINNSNNDSLNNSPKINSTNSSPIKPQIQNKNDFNNYVNNNNNLNSPNYKNFNPNLSNQNNYNNNFNPSKQSDGISNLINCLSNKKSFNETNINGNNNSMNYNNNNTNNFNNNNNYNNNNNAPSPFSSPLNVSRTSSPTHLNNSPPNNSNNGLHLLSSMSHQQLMLQQQQQQHHHHHHQNQHQKQQQQQQNQIQIQSQQQTHTQTQNQNQTQQNQNNIKKIEKCINCKITDCIVCEMGPPPSFEKGQIPIWAQILHVALFALTESSKVSQNKSPSNEELNNLPNGKRYFHLRDDIYEFINVHWDIICKRERIQNWKHTIGMTLSHYQNLFQNGYPIFQNTGYCSNTSSGSSDDDDANNNVMGNTLANNFQSNKRLNSSPSYGSPLINGMESLFNSSPLRSMTPTIGSCSSPLQLGASPIGNSSNFSIGGLLSSDENSNNLYYEKFKTMEKELDDCKNEVKELQKVIKKYQE
ncbi:hypothetical protein DICPUDRAFT_156383 [Dictyostelium purpureum]|uniref:Uncharacterized protein n=1 Tax=Dictyostelium purpureum TaxID=5786 RepID=F0ZWF5_DICPU|nr:uncharacterized protein DICPUDRAFT_156383 [Dictyostelium purpureum]EGC31714.1 hypothetical protein DICPUDRAFT_156383 [Dictyostelium purpureum]|eukprot:XP_003291748.1 hypothetical protein DICPUDRAFT_156383 [Dictyostelium purpureum]